MYRKSVISFFYNLLRLIIVVKSRLKCAVSKANNLLYYEPDKLVINIIHAPLILNVVSTASSGLHKDTQILDGKVELLA